MIKMVRNVDDFSFLKVKNPSCLRLSYILYNKKETYLLMEEETLIVCLLCKIREEIR